VVLKVARSGFKSSFRVVLEVISNGCNNNGPADNDIIKYGFNSY
jgi:hypothetical protein